MAGLDQLILWVLYGPWARHSLPFLQSDTVKMGLINLKDEDGVGEFIVLLIVGNREGELREEAENINKPIDLNQG